MNVRNRQFSRLVLTTTAVAATIMASVVYHRPRLTRQICASTMWSRRKMFWKPSIMCQVGWCETP